MAPTGQSPFYPPDQCNDCQLIFIFLIYAYVLFYASNLISDGSELLQLIPSIAGIVGSIVLPILGAVPDGMMVLFSGLGPDAQEQVSVGVGALAGSTIMLLTIPWFLAVLGGRVSIVAGCPQYRKPEGAPDTWDKLSPAGSMSLTGTGVGVPAAVPSAAKFMIATSMLYLIIQVPAYFAEKHLTLATEQGAEENLYALVGLVCCCLAFLAYLAVQYKQAQQSGMSKKAVEKIIAAIMDKQITLSAVMADIRQHNTQLSQEVGKGLSRKATMEKLPKEELSWIKKVMHPFFSIYDTDKSGTIGWEEFLFVIQDLSGTIQSKDQVKDLFLSFDADGTGTIDFDEFVSAITMWALDPVHSTGSEGLDENRRKSIAKLPDDDAEDGDDDEEENIPEDLADLSPDEQRKQILFRSFYMMGAGTLLVLVFSDPMVDVLSEIGVRLNVSAFYISFVLAPMASNASELVAAYNYAQKKTMNTIGISLSTLTGAACMNNTFCFGIFLALVYFRGLAWQFTAETISIISVQVVIGIIVQFKPVCTIMDALTILTLYPLSLALVYYLENNIGLD